MSESVSLGMTVTFSDSHQPPLISHLLSRRLYGRYLRSPSDFVLLCRQDARLPLNLEVLCGLRLSTLTFRPVS